MHAAVCALSHGPVKCAATRAQQCARSLVVLSSVLPRAPARARSSRMEAFKALEEAGAEAAAASQRRAELKERADAAGEEVTQLSAQLEAAGARRAHLQCAALAPRCTACGAPRRAACAAGCAPGLSWQDVHVPRARAANVHQRCSPLPADRVCLLCLVRSAACGAACGAAWPGRADHDP
jgi:hypothetical protein